MGSRPFDPTWALCTIAKYIAAEGTGYPHPLVLNLEPEGTQRFLELTVAPVGY